MGNPRRSPHHLKQVWHVLVHYGALTNSPEPRRWTAESALSDQATCGAPAIRDALDAALPRSGSPSAIRSAVRLDVKLELCVELASSHTHRAVCRINAIARLRRAL